MTDEHGASAARRAPAFAPGEADEALLRFVLADDTESVRYLHRWRTLVELDDASSASHHLLPSAYLRMESCAPDDPDLGRLRGIYRQRWAAGQQHLGAAAAAIVALDAAGVRFIRPPGQLAMTAVAEPLVLPLITPRITVPERETAHAFAALADAGWRLRTEEPSPSLRNRLIRTEWELELEAQPGLRILLGIDFNAVLRDRAYGRAVWERATATDGSGAGHHLAEHVPAPIDLFLALVCEAPRDPGALRWAIGALAVARQSTDFPQAESILRHPATGHLLRCIGTRLDFLASVDPAIGSLTPMLDLVEAAGAALDAPAPTRGAVAQQWAHRSRQAQVLTASLRRYGGLRKTARYLLDTRR